MDAKRETGKRGMTRRKLIALTWIGASVIVMGELIGGIFAFLWPRRKAGKGEKVFVLGKANEFKVGEVVAFRKEKTFLVRTENGFLAFSSVCTHLRCVVNWNQVQKRFECPCHGAKFNHLGEVLEGPPPRPLDLYKLQIVEGKLVVDTSNSVERAKYEPSQAVKG